MATTGPGSERVTGSGAAHELTGAVRVEYPSDNLTLSGYLNSPSGAGPFPDLIFNHGSNGLLQANLDATQEFVHLGYRCFSPIRRGANGNPGSYWLDLVTSEWGSPSMGEQLTEALRAESRDVVSAIDWLTSDKTDGDQRPVLVGQSFGAVVALMAAAERDVRAVVYFAGPSMSWPDAPALQAALLSAAAQIQAPVFFLQAQNDHSLAPVYVLAGALAQRGHPHEVRIYPRVGSTPIEGHRLFSSARELWRADVAGFLARTGQRVEP